MIVRVEVASFGVDPETGDPIVMLKACDSDTTLALPIAADEATPIAIKSLNVTSAPPLTIDLVGIIISQLGATLMRIVFAAGEQHVKARLHLRARSSVHSIECRASDALALAMRSSCPIFAEHTLFDDKQNDNEISDAEKLRRSIRSMNTLEFGRYFLE
jgi:bifunctional DNase/RNase